MLTLTLARARRSLAWLVVIVACAGLPACVAYPPSSPTAPSSPVIVTVTTTATSSTSPIIITPGCPTGCGTTTPTTPTTPAPTTPALGRTPDPAAGDVLDLPAYAAGIVAALLDAEHHAVAKACPTPATVTTPAAPATFELVDALIDRIRAFDTRWGYVCGTSASCSTVAANAIAFHATAGPDVAGALGIRAVVVVDCSGKTPEATFLPQAFAAAGVWGTRGRF